MCTNNSHLNDVSVAFTFRSVLRMHTNLKTDSSLHMNKQIILDNNGSYVHFCSDKHSLNLRSVYWGLSTRDTFMDRIPENSNSCLLQNHFWHLSSSVSAWLCQTVTNCESTLKWSFYLYFSLKSGFDFEAEHMLQCSAPLVSWCSCISHHKGALTCDRIHCHQLASCCKCNSDFLRWLT